MDNPAYFTVAWRADGLDWDFTDAGLSGSRQSADDEAAKRRANTDVPDMEFAVAVITMLEQDPATGTPLGHLAPPRPAGYALASLSTMDPHRRSLDHTIHPDLDTARGYASSVRRHSLAAANGAVCDIVAVTIIDHDPERAEPKEAHAA